MRKTVHIIFIAALLAAIISAAYFFIAGLSVSAAQEPARARFIEANAKPENDAQETASGSPAKTSFIPLAPGETLLDIYSLNLDTDEAEEQVLVVRSSDDSTGALHIIVADYSAQSKKWLRVWQGDTKIVNAKTLQISAVDLIGDHNQTIVCTGISGDNNQSMTVFWKPPNTGEKHVLEFIKIFEQSGTSLVIETEERPESYKLGQSNAESWPISVWKADPESSNFFDQVKETWKWNFSDKTYTYISTQKIAGASIAKEKIETVLDGTKESIQRFLTGTWYKESADPLSKNALFITFQPEDNLLMFSGDRVIEIYSWENSTATRYGLYITSFNQSVRNLRRLMDIELVSLDVLTVRIFQDYKIKADIAGTWDGRYRRQSPELAKSFVRQASAASLAESIQGNYAASSGEKLSLHDARYTWQMGARKEAGTFATYTVNGAAILDMRPDMPPGQKSLSRIWKADTSEQKLEDGSVMTILTLRSVSMSIKGIVESSESPFVFKQIK